MLKGLRQVVGGVEEGYVRIAERRVGEARRGAALLGRPQIQGLGVLHLGQEKIENPMTWLDRDGRHCEDLVRKQTYLGR